MLVSTVTHVRYGDAIEVNRTPVRFNSLDCAELGTLAGARAKTRILELAAGKTVTCRLTGERSYDRRIGSCELSDGRDLGAVMRREGFCSRWW